MRIGIAQLNGTVGDLHGNLALSIDAYEQLRSQNVDLIVYPELFLPDILQETSYLKKHSSRMYIMSLFSLQKRLARPPHLLGFLKHNQSCCIQENASMQRLGVKTEKYEKPFTNGFFRLTMFLMRSDTSYRETSP